VLLWLALVGALPVPILLLGPGHVPPASLIELGAISLALAAFESARGTVLPVAGIFLGQGLAYAGLLWLAAGLVLRAPRVGRALALGLAGALLLAALLRPIYHTPYHPTRAHVGLLEVYP
jgi:hypothetical protein